MINPLLEEAQRYPCKCYMSTWMGEFGCFLCDHDLYKLPIDDCSIGRRFKLAEKYAWAVPTEEIVQKIVSLGPTVEIGAGNGYWAWMIQQLGGEVSAYDVAPGDNHWCKNKKLYHPIAVGDSHSVVKHPDSTLLLCWPPMSNMAFYALARFKGTRVVYIGEGEGGCTANESFHDLLGKCWNETQVLDVPRWSGLHDHAYFYERKINIEIA